MSFDQSISPDRSWESRQGLLRRDGIGVLELRKKLGMTQEQLARELGVTVGTVNRWENGRFRPSPLAIRGLERLAERAERPQSTPVVGYSNGHGTA
jgi:putative transcriptional regulator